MHFTLARLLVRGVPLHLLDSRHHPPCLPQVMQWIHGYQEVLAEFGVEEQEVRLQC